MDIFDLFGIKRSAIAIEFLNAGIVICKSSIMLLSCRLKLVDESVECHSISNEVFVLFVILQKVRVSVFKTHVEFVDGNAKIIFSAFQPYEPFYFLIFSIHFRRCEIDKNQALVGGLKSGDGMAYWRVFNFDSDKIGFDSVGDSVTVELMSKVLTVINIKKIILLMPSVSLNKVKKFGKCDGLGVGIEAKL